MKKFLLTLSLAALLAGPTFAQAPQIDDARIAAVLKQYQAQFESGGKTLPAAEKSKLQDDIRKNLQRNELLKAEALKKGLDKEADTKALHANMEAEFYAGVLVNNFQNSLKITESMLQETYQLLRTEFQLEQASFADINSAKEALEALKKGKNFAELARENPTAEGVSGGWFGVQTLPPQLADQVLSMTRGAISSQPVLVEGKYVLFKVAGTRANPEFPTYDKVEPQLENLTKQLKTRNYLNSLFKDAGL